MTKFGKHPDRDAADLGAEALRGFRDLRCRDRSPTHRGRTCGHVFQHMVTGQRILAQAGMAGPPPTNVENACSSGATAIREASLDSPGNTTWWRRRERAPHHPVLRATPDPSDPEAAVGATMPAVYA